MRKELSAFKEYVREYQEAEGEEKEDLEYLLKKQLGDSSSFAAFRSASNFWIFSCSFKAFPV